MEMVDRYKIESFTQAKGEDGFLRRIERAAANYAEHGWEIISLAFPSKTEARLFMRK